MAVLMMMQSIRRGPAEQGGMIAEAKDNTVIRSAIVLSDLPDTECRIASAITSGQDFTHGVAVQDCVFGTFYAEDSHRRKRALIEHVVEQILGR